MTWRRMFKKRISLAIIAILTANLILLALGKITIGVFWAVILSGFIASYLIRRI